MKLLIQNAMIWRNRAWQQADLLVEGPTISQLAPRIDSAADQVLDARGKYVLPGIIDCHVHLSMNGGAHPMADLNGSREAQALLTAVKSAEELVRAGVTTVRDCGGVDRETILIRDAVKAGRLLGPRVVPCVKAIKIPGGHFFGAEVTGPQEARRAARELIAQGGEFVKLMATGGLGKAGEKPGVVELDIDEMKAAIGEGEKHGMASAAHCHSREGMLNALEAGVTTLEHCTFLDEEIVDKILAREVFLIPTFSPYCQMDRYGEESGVSPYMCRMAKEICAHKNRTFPLAYERGVKIAFGRDAGAPLTRHGEYYREMLDMEAVGMSRTDIIVSATETAAQALRLYDQVGSLEPGKCADLLVLDADPLADLRNFTKIFMVVAAGCVIQ